MPATSAVLTGLSLATSIAREATDSVPIVKQVLGVASRIVGLAEQIDKNREELHALAARAKKMHATITSIVGDRDLDDRLLRRLEHMNGALCAVEKHFENHIKQGRVRKALRYIFTIRRDIDRFRGDLDDRLNELEVASSLDTNLVSRENSRFIGEVRNIRHCEITLLRPIPPVHDDIHWGFFKETLHLANCEGSNKVFIVRNMQFSSPDEDQRRRIEEYNRILEHLSLIQNLHPSIARIYGRNHGPKHNRFVVLDAGDIRPFKDALEDGSADMTVLGQLVAQLADASCHLEKHGAAWSTGLSPISRVYVNHNYRPTIGLADDLYTLRYIPGSHVGGLTSVLGAILAYSTATSPLQDHPFPDAHRRITAWNYEIFGRLIDAGYPTMHWEAMVRRDHISRLIPLSQESRTYLGQAHSSYSVSTPDWGVMLLRQAVARRECEGRAMAMQYHAYASDEWDRIFVYCIEAGADVFSHTTTHFEIPRSAAEDVRRQLGISLDGEGVRLGWGCIMTILADGTLSPECLKWVEWDGIESLW